MKLNVSFNAVEGNDVGISENMYQVSPTSAHTKTERGLSWGPAETE